MDERKEYASTAIFVDELRAMERDGWEAHGESWTGEDGRARVMVRKRLRTEF